MSELKGAPINSCSGNTYASDPVIRYNYPYGHDARSNALGFLNDFHKTQNQINNIHKGGGCATTWQTFTDGIGANCDVLIPQFDEVNAVSPQSGSSASLKNNRILVGNKAGRIYDKFAYVGGKKRRKKTMRKRKSKRRKKTMRKRKSKRRKSKNLKRKSKILKKTKRKSSK
jgi:hypothetical protein